MISQLLRRRGSRGLLWSRRWETGGGGGRPLLLGAHHDHHHPSPWLRPPLHGPIRTIFMSDKPHAVETPRLSRKETFQRRVSKDKPKGSRGVSKPLPASSLTSKLCKTHTMVDHGDDSKPRWPEVTYVRGRVWQNVIMGTGILARQCDGAAIAMQGGSVVLATVVSSKQPMTGEDFLPLVVEYREKAHAFGRINRNATRREGGQTEDEVLRSRAIDRVIRPLFPDGYYFDTQVVTTVESADGVNDLTVLSVNAASVALTLSDVPWEGPVGCVKVGKVDGKLVVNPSEEEMKRSTLDLIYAGNEEKTLMIEAGAHQLSEEDMERALKFAHSHCTKVIASQVELAAKVKPHKRAIPPDLLPTTAMWERAEDVGLQAALAAFTDITDSSKADQGALQAKVMGDIVSRLKEEFPDANAMAPLVCADGVMKKALRSNILDRESRCDGRSLDGLRHITGAVDILPRVHGSAIFSRGETQVLCGVTLGSDEDGIMPRYGEDESERKKVFLHYDFPPYSTNETGKVFGANRRMIGHGALAERAVLPLLPPPATFPYTVRITSEVTSSNGSSSMASACGASLALMDAGVPISAPVAGSSVGLVTEVDEEGRITRYKLLNDIIGLEDHYGDMDFKVAGTSNGITAIQLDVKLKGGVPLPILCEGIRMAKNTRQQMLGVMSKAAREPRPALKSFAPRMEVIHYPFELHKDLFTLENRRLIADDYNVTLAFPEDGKVTIFGRDSEKVALAHQHVQELVAEVTEGEVYMATVIGIKDYGAVVEILRGKEGLLHMSEISHNGRGRGVHEMLAVGQKIKVKCLAVDRIRGTVKVSRKALLDPSLPDNLKPEPAEGFVSGSLSHIPIPAGTNYTHVDLKKVREERRRKAEAAEGRGEAEHWGINDHRRGRGRPRKPDGVMHKEGVTDDEEKRGERTRRRGRPKERDGEEGKRARRGREVRKAVNESDRKAKEEHAVEVKEDSVAVEEKGEKDKKKRGRKPAGSGDDGDEKDVKPTRRRGRKSSKGETKATDGGEDGKEEGEPRTRRTRKGKVDKEGETDKPRRGRRPTTTSGSSSSSSSSSDG